MGRQGEQLPKNCLGRGEYRIQYGARNRVRGMGKEITKGLEKGQRVRNSRAGGRLLAPSKEEREKTVFVGPSKIGAGLMNQEHRNHSINYRGRGKGLRRVISAFSKESSGKAKERYREMFRGDDQKLLLQIIVFFDIKG